jgi:hypothetical protein
MREWYWTIIIDFFLVYTPHRSEKLKEHIVLHGPDGYQKLDGVDATASTVTRSFEIEPVHSLAIGYPTCPTHHSMKQYPEWRE